MTSNIKHIAVIESLENERLTGTEIYHNVIEPQIKATGSEMKRYFHKTPSKQDLVEILKYYQANAPYLAGGLLIHLEMHGDTGLKGLVLSDGSYIIWKELIELFRPINVATCNKLYITMATCNGRYLYQGVDPYQKSPYSGYISASKSVYDSEIFDKFSILFKKLIESGNLVNAYLEMEKTESNFYYKDSETTFQENFEEFSKKEEYKEQLVEYITKVSQGWGQSMPDEIPQQLYDKALKDIYDRQKKAFDFSDC